MRAIVRRDMGEHGWLFFPACILALVALVALLGRSLGQPDAVLAAFSDFVLLILGPLALLLARQLVVVEHARRGYALLEALPVRRWAVLPAKAFAAGALLAGVLVGGVALTATLLGLFGQVPDDTSTQLAEHAAAVLAALLGVAFLVAAFGRHRHAAGLLVLAGAVACTGVGDAGHDLAQLPPVRIAAQRFTGPPSAIAPSAAIGLAALALATALTASTRFTRAVSGPVGVGGAARAVGLALVLGLIAGGDRLGRRPALRLDGPLAGEGAVRVRIPDPAEAARAEAVARDAGAAVDALAAAVGRAPAGPLLVEPAQGLVGWGTERVLVRGADGIVLRTAYLDPAWDPDAFRARLLAAVLDQLAPDLDPGWALARDGYPRWLALSTSGDEARLRERRRVAAILGVAAGGLGASPPAQGAPSPLASLATASSWAAWRGRLSGDDAAALAAWVLGALEATRGAEAVHALGRRVVEARPGGALAAALEAQGLDLAALEARAAAARDGERAWLDAQAPARLEVEPEGAGGGRLALRFRAVGPASEAGAPRARVAALLHRLADAPGDAERDEVLVDGPAATTRATYAPGARVACALVVDAPGLGERAAGWAVVELPR